MQVLDKGFIELVNHMGDDNTVVSAARVSRLGEGSKGVEQDAKLIKYLLKNKHTSPFEQVTFQFLVKCPVFVARQWHRHRTWSYNEVSRRYTSDKIDFHIPDELRKQAETNKQASDGRIESNEAGLIHEIESHSNLALMLYEILISSGVAREQARMVLPQNMYTSFYGTVNLHNLFHFLSLRNKPDAQKEIRVYAEAMETLIQPVVPISYATWKEFDK